MVRPKPDIVHVGAASRDLADDDPRGWRLGGGVAYAALTTAGLGLRTGAIVGVDAVTQAEAWELDDLRTAGVEIIPVPIPDGPVFVNLEQPTGRVQISPAVGGPVDPAVVPPEWRDPAVAWSLVPVAGELPPAWAEVPAADAPVIVAWQGLLRTLRPGARVARRPPARSAVLDRADLVGVSEHDLPPGTDPLSLLTLLRRGAQLAVTRGADGGELLQAGRAPQRYASVVGGDEVDATGAGDVFLATLAAVRLRPILADGADGLTVAAGAASLAVERPGLAGVPRLEDVRSRLATIASRGGLRD